MNNQDFQDAYEERAAIMEFDAKMPRKTAEEMAYKDMMKQWEK